MAIRARTVSKMDLAATIGVGLVVAAAVGLVAHLSRIEAWQAVAGGVLGGSLAGLAAGDGFIESAGPYWARHPMMAAGLGAVLLLGLTVIVIDAAIEHGNTLRRREAAKTPVRRSLTRAREAHAKLEDALHGDTPDARAVSEAGSALNAAVIATRTMTPLLLSSKELLCIYDTAEAFTHCADDVVLLCGEYRRERVRPQAEMSMREWTEACKRSLLCSQGALDEFDEVASEILGASRGEASPSDAHARN